MLISVTPDGVTPTKNASENWSALAVTRRHKELGHRYGEAHASVSSSFLEVAGARLNATGEAHGQFNKMLGLFPSLTLAPIPGGPTLKETVPLVPHDPRRQKINSLRVKAFL